MAFAHQYFERVEDYVAWMSDPDRVVHVEWRKVRHEKSRGLTSHSWLEIRLLDDRRVRLEIYADRGYTELNFDPRQPSSESMRFFDPESTIYDGRVAGLQELARPLTADILRKEAKQLAKRPYSLSEFNCHHFVLELWNSIVVSALQSSHYPDRAKIGILWGVEEVIGHWFQGGGSLASVGAPRQSVTGAMAAMGTDRSDRSDRSDRLPGRLPECLENVFVLETTGPMRLAELPPASSPDVHRSRWASMWPGLEEHALRLVEIIYKFDIEEVAKSLDIQLPSSSLARFSSLSSVSGWEHCFVILRGKELRVAVHTVGPKRLLLLSGDAMKHEECDWDWLLDSHNLSAAGRAFQQKEDLQCALRRRSFQSLLGDRCSDEVFQDL